MQKNTNKSLVGGSNRSKKDYKHYTRKVVVDILVQLLIYIDEGKTKESKAIRLDLVLSVFGGNYMMGITDAALAKKHGVHAGTMGGHRREFMRKFPLVRALTQSVS